MKEVKNCDKRANIFGTQGKCVSSARRRHSRAFEGNMVGKKEGKGKKGGAPEGN